LAHFNPNGDYPTFVSHLECSLSGEHYPADTLQGLSDVGRPLLVRYDLPAIANAITKEELRNRVGSGFWRYREFLPVRDCNNVVCLGEETTPLVELKQLGEELKLGQGRIIVKDEGRLPTGSFKARGLALAPCSARTIRPTSMSGRYRHKVPMSTGSTA
jgi:threonine synthase